jgi:hypothetical protein
VYISKQKKLEENSWAAIKESKKKWTDWPMNAFYNRWRQIKDKNLHLQQPLLVRSADHIQGNGHGFAEPIPGSPIWSHHLPTPSSSEHEESRKNVVDPTDEEDIHSGLLSSAQFDDDERELLSLAGEDIDEDPLPVPIEEETLHSAPEDVILPSIEMRDFVDESKLQEDLLEDLPTWETTSTPVRPGSIEVKVEPVLSTPSSTRKRKRLPISFEVMPDSDAEDDEDDTQTLSTVMAQTTSRAFICKICQKPFKSANSLTRHQQDPRNTHNTTLRRSASIDLVGDDDLLAPTTPHIKRETSTPHSTFLSAFQTPKALPHRRDLNESGSKPTSKVDRKSFLKQVKQSWTTKSTPAPKTITKRKSFHTLPRKRVWSADEGSADELAM